MEKIRKFFTEIALCHPFKALLFVVLMQVLMLPSINLIKENFDIKIWFDEASKSYKNLEEFEKRFGNDEAILIAIHDNRGIFNKEAIKIVHDLTEKMRKTTQVIKVESLTNFNWIEAKNNTIEVATFLSFEKDYSDLDLQKKRELATSHPILKNYLVSEDGKTAVIFSSIRGIDGAQPDYKNITKAAREYILPYKDIKNLTVKVSGQIPLYYAFKEAADGDLFNIFPILLCIIILYLVFVFKSKVGVIYPFAIIICTLSTTIGLGFYIGEEINNITATVPLLLVAVCLAGSIHLLSSYFQFISKGEDRKTAISSAINKNLKPTILTSVSTMVGFLSLTTTSLKPIASLGVLAAMGAFFAWLYTYLLIGPILLSFRAGPNKFFNHDDGNIESSLSFKLCQFIVSNQKKIIYTISVLCLLALYLSLKIVPNSNPYRYFKENSLVQTSNNFIIDKMGGSQGIEIIVNSGEIDGIKSPIFLKKVEEFKSYLESNPRISKSTDFINLIKTINQAFHNGNINYFAVPETRKQVSSAIFFYSSESPQEIELNKLVDLESKRLRMSLLWDYQDSRESFLISKEIEKKAKDLDLNIIITGKEFTYQLLVGKIVSSFFISLFCALLVVALLLSISFKSIKIGIFSLLPNVVPMLFGLAFLQLMGIYLDLGTCMVFAITLGISVDDTIHFISSFDRLSHSIKNKHKRMLEVFKTTGKALFVTTMVLVTSFSALAFGQFVPNINFGMTSAFVLVAALILDLVFLPSLLFLRIFSFFEKDRQRHADKNLHSRSTI